jgi:hypothetical protein
MSTNPRRRRPAKRMARPVLLALIAAGAVVVAALIGILPKLIERLQRTESVQRSAPGAGRIEGTLTDRAGSPLSGMSVGISNGPQTQTDSQGKFVMNDAPSGDQTVEVQSPSKKGLLTQTIRVEANQTTSVNVIYDTKTSRLGLLSITAPVDGGLLELRQDGDEYRAVIYGRCDGLEQIFNGFDVWVLMSSEHDLRFWLQQPPAIVDPSAGTWRAKALFGSREHPPQDKERWDIIAIAADSGSQIGRVINTPNLNLLPLHIRSNTVTVETRMK